MNTVLSWLNFDTRQKRQTRRWEEKEKTIKQKKNVSKDAWEDKEEYVKAQLHLCQST